VILDALHWSGNNTTHDALAFGTPIVTLPSEFMRGRVTYGCYKQIGVMDCVASSKEEYVALAVRLGTDRDYRRMVKEKILASNGALYENVEAVRELERFFVQAVEAVNGSW
jgi:predicted O-linked N-acetylglucosamine transferase (SPINDLY family)